MPEGCRRRARISRIELTECVDDGESWAGPKLSCEDGLQARWSRFGEACALEDGVVVVEAVGVDEAEEEEKAVRRRRREAERVGLKRMVMVWEEVFRPL